MNPDSQTSISIAQHLALGQIPGDLASLYANALVGMQMGDLPASRLTVTAPHQWTASSQPLKIDIKPVLSAYLPCHIRTLLTELQSIVNRLGVSGYVIGGIPRDLLLSSDRALDIQDVDITLEGNVIELIAPWLALSDNFVCQAIYPEYGTATLLYKGEVTVDVASTRTERYTAMGAMPTVEALGVPLVNDLMRRDFSINTLALSLNNLGVLIDTLGQGLNDLDKGLIRTLSPISFYEDPTRLLRALRFAAKFGFSLSPDTLEMAKRWWEDGPRYYRGGGERIAVELKRLLLSWIRQDDGVPEAQIVLAEDLSAFGLMDTQQTPLTLPDKSLLLSYAQRLQQAYQDLAHWPQLNRLQLNELLFQVWLCWLSPYMAEPQHVLNRLGLDKCARQAVQQFAALQWDNPFAHAVPDKPHTRDARLYQVMKGLPLATLVALWLQSRLLSDDNRFSGLNSIQYFWYTLRQTQSLLDGDALHDLGLPEGEIIGRVKQALIQAQLSGQLGDTENAVTFVQDWLTVNAPDIQLLNHHTAA